MKPPSKKIDKLAPAAPVIFGVIADVVKPPPPINFIEWSRKNIVFGNESEFQGNYDPDLFPFYKRILECLQPGHPARVVVLIKSAQIGGSVTAQVFAGASLDLDPGPFFYVHPSLENGARWATTKWKPFVQNSKALTKIFPSERSRDRSNKLLFKERVDQRGYLLISGANSPSSLSMMSFPRQVQDDLSKWMNNEAGDSESQADSRSEGFEFAKIFKLSTPLIKGACKINKNYERSTQEEWHVPCPHCGHRFALRWENLKASIHQGMEYGDAHFTCPENGCVIEHHHKRKMVGAGSWIAQNPGSNVPGFWIWAAYSPLTTWARIAEKWLKAEGDPEAEKNFYNDTAGEAYEQKGEAPPWRAIAERSRTDEGYTKGRIPLNALIITCGVDCQGDRIECHIKGYGPNLQRFTIDYEVIDGHISEDETRKKLNNLLNRKWKNAYGREIGIDMLAIDANYSTQDVLDWAKKHPENRVIAVRGGKGEHLPPLTVVSYERKKGVKVKKRQKRFFTVGVSALKIALFKHLEKIDVHARGYCGYPSDLDDEFFIQLCSERRVLITNKKTQYAILEWQKLPNTRNEVLDTEIYAEAAARRLGWTDITEDGWDKLRRERESKPSGGQMDLLDQNFAEPAKETVEPVKPEEKKPEQPKSRASQLA